MGLHVRPQIRAVGERARTNVALERFFARVRPHVSLQQPRPAEALAAYLTLARERVRPYVHFERAQRRVRLLAILAREMLLYLRAAVKLLVLGQTAECGIALAAPIALVSRYSGLILAQVRVFLSMALVGFVRERRADPYPDHAVYAVVRRALSAARLGRLNAG